MPGAVRLPGANRPEPTVNRQPTSQRERGLRTDTRTGSKDGVMLYKSVKEPKPSSKECGNCDKFVRTNRAHSERPAN